MAKHSGPKLAGLDDAFAEVAHLEAATQAPDDNRESAPALDPVASAPTPDAESVGSFNYDQIEPEHREDLRKHAVNIRRRTTETVLAIGQELLWAKSLLKDHYPRGTWSDWLASGVEMSESTARNAMAAVEWFAKTPTVGVLVPGALYKGAVAPTEVQAEIVRRISAGESISADKITALVKARKAETPQPAGNDPDQGGADVPPRAMPLPSERGEQVSGDAGDVPVDAAEASAAPSSRVGAGEQLDGAIEAEQTAEMPTNEHAESPLGSLDPIVAADTETLAVPEREREAALELLARLRELIDEEEKVVSLVELWRETTYEAIKRALTESSIHQATTR